MKEILFLICWVIFLQFIHDNVECLVDLHWNHKHWPDGHRKI